VDKAVIKSIQKGVNSSLNCPEEVILSKELLKIHPWFDMARFARGGGEAMAIAVRIARAFTNKEKILFSGYHGWEDWYLSANLNKKSNLDGHLLPGLNPKGVPRSMIKSSIPFDINNLEELDKIIKKNKNNVAAIVIEPARANSLTNKTLIDLKKITKRNQIVLIFDEITTGFRECLGGIHRKYKVYPDIAVFAKSMANGYAMSAILGTENVMQSFQDTFVSSTNWTERIGPTASIATISKLKSTKAHLHIKKIGRQIKKIWKLASHKHGINIDIFGIDSLPGFNFVSEYNNKLNNIFVSKMLDYNILAFRQFKPSYSHSQKNINFYAENLNKTFKHISELDYKEIVSYTEAHSGFKRLFK